MRHILKTISLSAIAAISLSTPSYATSFSKSGDKALTPESQFQTAMNYLRQKDYKNAVPLFHEAALQGYDVAEYNLGLCYYNGRGVKQDYKNAAYYFKESMKHDSLGDSSAVDQEKAVEGYIPELSLEVFNEEDYEEDISSEAAAQYDLAQQYIEENNTQEAIKCLTLAAENGHPYAQGQLARLYAEAHDYENALYWYKKANDYIGDEATIGEMLYDMAFYTNDNNYPIFLQEAVNRGNTNALVDLACLYAMGELVERDDNKAVELYRRYVNNLNYSHLEYYGVSKQNITIADVYFYIFKEWFHISRGDLDSKAEIPYLMKAAELGHCKAQLTVGYMYNSGDEYYGYKQDYVEAAKWFTKAADQGNPYAQLMLGDYYNEGKGVDKDFTQAFQWYKKVADQDLADAFYQLGEYYANGYGVKKDMTLADEYYKKAATAFKTKAEEYFDNNE